MIDEPEIQAQKITKLLAEMAAVVQPYNHVTALLAVGTLAGVLVAKCSPDPVVQVEASALFARAMFVASRS